MRVSEGKTFGGETREMPPLWGEGRPVRPVALTKRSRMALLPKIAEPREPESPDNGVHLEIGSRQMSCRRRMKKTSCTLELTLEEKACFAEASPHLIDAFVKPLPTARLGAAKQIQLRAISGQFSHAKTEEPRRFDVADPICQ